MDVRPVELLESDQVKVEAGERVEELRRLVTCAAADLENAKAVAERLAELVRRGIDDARWPYALREEAGGIVDELGADGSGYIENVVEAVEDFGDLLRLALKERGQL